MFLSGYVNYHVRSSKNKFSSLLVAWQCILSVVNFDSINYIYAINYGQFYLSSKLGYNSIEFDKSL